MPATSQLDWLISITAITVLSGSRRVRHRLRSFNFCMGRSIDSHQRRWIQHPRRYPIASLLAGLSPAGMAASLAALARPRPAPTLWAAAGEALRKSSRSMRCAHLRRRRKLSPQSGSTLVRTRSTWLGWTSGAPSFCSRRYPAVSLDAVLPIFLRPTCALKESARVRRLIHSIMTIYAPCQKKRMVRPAPSTTMIALISRWSIRCAPCAAA